MRLFTTLILSIISLLSYSQSSNPIIDLSFDNDVLSRGSYNDIGIIHGNISFVNDRVGNSCSAVKFNGNSFIELPHDDVFNTI